MLSRIFQLLADSFKFLYREKINFYISSVTISICIILLAIISNISFKLIKKIDTINQPPLVVTYEDLDLQCEDCPIHEDFTDSDPINGKWDPEEDFTDSNGNRIYDTHDSCPECDIYDSKFLNVLVTDSNSDIQKKKNCKECIENKLGMIDGQCFNSYELVLGCDSECTPNRESSYASNEYNEGEYFKDINGNNQWDEGLEHFINNDYYGSRKKTKCRGCLHFMYLEARNNVRFMEKINNELNYTDKIGALIEYETFTNRKYFNRPDRLRIEFPTQSEFEIDENIDSVASLDSMIHQIIDLEYVQDIDNESMLDYSTFVSYRQLSKIITSSIPVLIFFILLIPFFIVSNTVRLVIHSKRDVLNTLRILGEKDFYIKLPFIFQGVWQGIVGSFIAIFFIYSLNFIGLGEVINNIINTVLIQSSTNIVDNNLIYGFNNIAIILFLGIILGIFGALRAISKYLR